MDALVPFLVLLGVLAAVLGFFAWLASHIRRRGLAGGAMSAALASFEEGFRITAHEAHHEIRAQADRKAPLLSPDDDWRRARRATDQPRTQSRRSPRTSGRPRRRLARWARHLRPGR
ncbi:hypothetical protein ACTWQF_27650 [Streptomyces sp. 8N114]|uniref:hypothetical protein n=1 Tax=Streptomyces sp. 8N114 TaxID=3457419 RepID=UPI003FD5380D